MADNSLQNGTDNIATDDIGGVKHQRVKVQYGADGSATDVSPTTPLPSVIRDALGTAAGFRPDGVIRVAMDPTTLILDTFETLDTTDAWTTSGTVVPTGSAGALLVQPGTAASATSAIRSKAAFTNGAAGFLNYVSAWVLEAGAVTGNKRVWGLGVPNPTPTLAAPILNGVVFELQDTDGALVAVAYSNSVRGTPVALTRPTDAAAHRYSIFHRASRTYFDIDGVVVGSIAFPNPQVNSLPAVAVSVNGGAIVASAPVLQSSVVGVADTGRNSTAFSDPKFPWRKARVTPSGELVTTDTLRIKQATGLAHSGRFTVGATADAATVGRLWLINPVGSAVLLELRRVEFSSAPTAATAFVTSPRVTVERVTFTGTASGAQITPAVKDSTDTALVGTVRTASTGLALSAGAVAYGFTVVPILTAVGAAVPSLQEWEPAENGRLVLRAGQGIVVRQADAGTTADTRSFAVNLAWSEYTVMA